LLAESDPASVSCWESDGAIAVRSWEPSILEGRWGLELPPMRTNLRAHVGRENRCKLSVKDSLGAWDLGRVYSLLRLGGSLAGSIMGSGPTRY